MLSGKKTDKYLRSDAICHPEQPGHINAPVVQSSDSHPSNRSIMPLLKSLKKKLGKKEKSDKASTRPESISKKPQPIPKHRLSQSYDITPSALPAPLPSPLPLKQTSSATGPASITTAHRSSLSQSSAASPVGYQTPPSPHSPYRSPAPSSPRSPEFSTLFVQDQSRRYQPSDQLLDQLVTSYTAASKAPEPVPPSPAEDVASMAMLPVELLEQIFLYSMPSTTSSRRTEFNRKSEPLNLTYVCSRWRAILLSRPKLWSSLVVISPQNRGISNLIRAWLSRSGDEPLHLALSASRSSPVVLDIVSQMVAHADRWKSIYFSLDFAGMPPVGSLLSMPLLESVDVEISAEQDCQFINRLWEGLAESTSLRTVHIIGHCAPPRPVYWPNVVDLDLDGMAWDLCLQILAGCPNVESLVLNQLNAPLTPTLALSHRPDAQLSKLTNLRFRTMRSLRKPLYDMNIIDHLTTPSLINLALSAFNRPEMVEAIAGLILRSHARLEQFIIQYDLLLVSTLTLLQQEYMQNLRVLRLVHLPISREVLWGLSDTVTYIPGAGGGGAATGLQPKHLKGLEEIQLAVKTKPDDNLGSDHVQGRSSLFSHGHYRVPWFVAGGEFHRCYPAPPRNT
ncbi:hypothetical protein DL96DRAFT_722292 [Flagelloscypha sp. PMI_526]|nr:hypothetical protein DL96DRAFT_722292 [Flagelloscypha sp. PMI_526]